MSCLSILIPLNQAASTSFFASHECILHQGGDGHRTYASGYGGDIAAAGRHFVEFYVSFQGKAALFSAVGDAGDTYVDDDSAFLYHVCGHELWFSQGGNQGIRAPAYLRE